MRKRAEQYSNAVLARFPKGKGTRVKLAVRNDKSTGVLDFKGIPVDQMNLLLEALKSQQST
ncbi:hypothetical protein [Hyalangium versicolor]|uniref:hypothetical protein n=1 Tax=Hyalangium versicolor TaxID=2861190 RepID=UPI001CCBCDA8|nr:hypothetical protein [Hyalangium versicolor]